MESETGRPLAVVTEVTPETVKAEMHREMSEPGSADK